MITWILLVLDLISFASLTLLHFNHNVAFQLVLMSVVYLLGKGFVFKDGMSIIDGFCGFYLLIAWMFNLSWSLIYWLILIWFGYKLLMTIVRF
jgi:hypothetical protein